jgi:hypothetical protein
VGSHNVYFRAKALNAYSSVGQAIAGTKGQAVRGCTMRASKQLFLMTNILSAPVS